MKKILLLLAALPFALFSQSTNKGYHFGSDRSYEMVSINQKSYYLERSYPIQACCVETVNLVCVNAQGQTLYRNLVASYPLPQNAQISVTNNKTLLILAGSTMAGCDVMYNEFKILLYDTNGTNLMTHTEKRDIWYCRPKPNGEILLVTGDLHMRYSSSGTFIDSLHSGITTSADVIVLRSGKTLQSYPATSGPKLRKTQPNGTLITEVLQADLPGHLLEAPDSSIYAIASGHLKKYSRNLGLLHSSNNVTQSGLYTAFTLHSDTVFVTGQNASGQPFYVVLDSALNLVHSAVSNVEASTATGISVTGSLTNIITWGSTFNNTPQFFTGLYQTTRTGSLSSQQDVGLLNLTVGPTWMSIPGVMAATVQDVTVTIKNLGPDTLKQINLNCFSVQNDGIMSCHLGLNHTYSVLVPPNGTQTVSTGSFYIAASANSATANVCLFSTIPNAMNDENLTNDGLCQNVVVTSLASHGSMIGLKLFPNPTYDQFHIESDSPIQSLQVFDQLGRTIRSADNLNATDYLVEGLNAGLYIVQIKTSVGAATEKIIVAR